MSIADATALVESADPSRLQRRIVDAFSTASADDLDVLSRLLKPLESAETDMRHCLRCHKNVDFARNFAYACRIPHTERPVSIRFMLGAGDLEPGQDQWQLQCCNHTWRGDPTAVSSPPEPFCVVGRHTDNFSDVHVSRALDMDAYTDDLGTAFGYEGPVLGRAPWRIPTCDRLGCL